MSHSCLILFCPLFPFLTLSCFFFFFLFLLNCLCHILFIFLLEGILCKPFFSLYFSNDLYQNGNISHYPLMKNGLVECFHSTLSCMQFFPDFEVRFYDFQHRELLLNHCVLLGKPDVFICKSFCICSLVLVLILLVSKFSHQGCNTTVFPFLNSIFWHINKLLIYKSLGRFFLPVLQYLLLTSSPHD